MSRAADIASRLVMLNRRMGSETFTLDGTDYECACSVIGRQEVIDVGGFNLNIRARLFVTRDELGSVVPESGDIITFRSNRYRVALVDDIEGAALQLHLADVDA